MQTPLKSNEKAHDALASFNILVVEDEPFIAFDIAEAVDNSGHVSIGPAFTIKSALQLLSAARIDGAILDVNLPDGDIEPVVDLLTAKSIPFIIHTGAGLTEKLRHGYPELRVYFKPTSPDLLVRSLLKSFSPGPRE